MSREMVLCITSVWRGIGLPACSQNHTQAASLAHFTWSLDRRTERERWELFPCCVVLYDRCSDCGHKQKHCNGHASLVYPSSLYACWALIQVVLIPWLGMEMTRFWISFDHPWCMVQEPCQWLSWDHTAKMFQKSCCFNCYLAICIAFKVYLCRFYSETDKINKSENLRSHPSQGKQTALALSKNSLWVQCKHCLMQLSTDHW